VHPHILCKHKLLFWLRLIAINHLTALVTIDRVSDKHSTECQRGIKLNLLTFGKASLGRKEEGCLCQYKE